MNTIQLSHKLGIAPKDLNKLQNKLFGIECNFEELNGLILKKVVMLVRKILQELNSKINFLKDFYRLKLLKENL